MARRSKQTQPEAEPTDLCPYCGVGVHADVQRCWNCTGMLDEHNRRLIQQHLGPWYIRLPQMAFRPGCSYAVLRDMAKRGKVEADTVLRGPTTRQYWMFAKDTPGVAHLLGICHVCGQWVRPTDRACPHCSREFPNPDHRNYLGLDPDNRRIIEDAVKRERVQAQPAAQPQQQAAAANATTSTGGPRPQPQPAAGAQPPASASTVEDGEAAAAAARAMREGGGDATSADSLFELAAATTGSKAPLRQSAVPRSSKRGGLLFWGLVAVNVLLIGLLITIVVMFAGGGGEEEATEETGFIRNHETAWVVNLPDPPMMTQPLTQAPAPQPLPLKTDR